MHNAQLKNTKNNFNFNFNYVEAPTLNKDKQTCLCTHLNGAFNFQLNKL